MTPAATTPRGQAAGQTSSTRTISNAQRLLILTPTSQSQLTIPPILKSLTGTAVTEIPRDPSSSASSLTAPEHQTTPTTAHTSTTPSTSFAGYTTHTPLRVRTKYYSADVPIWVDEIPVTGTTTGHPGSDTDTTSSTGDAITTSSTTTTTETGNGDTGHEEASSSSPPIAHSSQWKSEFSSPEARIVRDAIGAVMICALNPEVPHIYTHLRMERAAARDDPESASITSTEAMNLESILSERDDVRGLKELVKSISEVKAQIEEERGDGMGEVPGLLVLVSRTGRVAGAGDTDSGMLGGRSTALRDPGGDEEANDDGPLEELDAPKPFTAGWWEDQLFDMGVMEFEVVTWDPTTQEVETRNKFGEYEGMRRIREVLETHDWAIDGGHTRQDDDLVERLLGLDEDHGDAERDYDDEGEEEDDGFKLEVNQLEREMLGLRMAIERGGGDGLDGFDDDENNAHRNDEVQVESLEALMMRMKAIRDMSAELPENERKRFAARAVQDIMREL